MVGWISQWMNERMDGCMDGGLNLWLWLWLLLWLRVNIAAYTYSTEAINSTATAGSTLTATEVPAAYATAAADPLLGK